MVSSRHESPHHLFRGRPEAVGRAIRSIGFDFPDTAATAVLPADATEIVPLERRVDTVVRIDTKDGRSLVIAIEVQGKPDPRKLRSWPYYIAYLHERHSLPVILMVITQDRPTSMWAQNVISVGTDFWTSMTVQPMVLGPHNVPFPAGRIEAEEDLPMAVLAAVIHGREPGIDGILSELSEALKGTDEETRADLSLYIELGLAGLPAELTWRKLMSFTRENLSKSPAVREILDAVEEQSRAEGLAEGLAEGRVEARVASVLDILDKRKVSLTDAERERIRSCTDLGLADRWFNAALDAETADDVFSA